MPKKKTQKINLSKMAISQGRQLITHNASMSEMLKACAVNRPMPSRGEMDMIKQLFGESATKEVFGD